MFPEGRACRGQGPISQPPQEEARRQLLHLLREGSSIKSLERLPPVKTWGWEIHQQASSLATLGCQGHSGSDCAPFPAFSHQRLRPASGNPPVLLKIVLGLTDLLTKETTSYTQINNFNI